MNATDLTKEYKADYALLALLAEYVVVCDIWEEHYTKAANKSYADLTEEKGVHASIMSEQNAQIFKSCKLHGYTYAQLIDIIPPAFSTTSQERSDILLDLEIYLEEKYEAPW